MFHKLNNLLKKWEIKVEINLCKKLIISNNLKYYKTQYCIETVLI